MADVNISITAADGPWTGGVKIIPQGYWWDPGQEGLDVWAAYAPKGAASLAASYKDLSGHGNDAGVGSAPAWDSTNGWKFNGSSHYLTTTFIPADDQSQSLIVQFSNVTNTGFLCGTLDAADLRFGFRPNVPTNCYYSNGGTIGVSPVMTSGNLAVAGNAGYRNGTAEGGSIGAWGVSSYAMYIARLNTASGYIAAYIQGLALYSSTLTAEQVARVAAAMAAL